MDPQWSSRKIGTLAVKFFVWAGLSFLACEAHAFPELIRHGYVHCTTCHISPTGGGLLTAYGRSLSKELVSRWSNESGEQELGHGIFHDTRVAQWLNSDVDHGLFIGGDFRVLQYHREDQTLRTRKFFPMQVDVEAAYRWEDGSFGATYGVEKRGDQKKFDFRRYQLILRTWETIWTRIGLGTPHFALMTSEHHWAIRERLGFGPLDRRFLVEVEHQGETWGALLGFAESDSTMGFSREKAGYGNLDFILQQRKKIGFHYFQGSQRGSTRALTGLHALLGWDEHWVTLAQATVKTQSTHLADSQAWSLFQKTSWEFTKGLWASFNLDATQEDQGLADSRILRSGPGFQFFPRPHFEIQMVYLRVDTGVGSANDGDEAFFIGHYYF